MEMEAPFDGLLPTEDTKFSFCIIVPRMNLAGMVDYFFISLIMKQNRSRDIFYCSFFVDNKKNFFFHSGRGNN